MTRLLLLALLLIAPSMAGAAAPEPEQAWRKGIEARGIDAERAVYPFAVTAEMQSFARDATRHWNDPLDKLEALQAALFDPARFDFTYDRTATSSAPDAFASRRGNCLAFTSLFIALARSQGLMAELVALDDVLGADDHKEDDLVVLSRHVVAGYRYFGTMYLYDFAEGTDLISMHWSPVDDVSATALVHGNRGASALRAGSYVEARRELDIAAALAPDRASTWVNLGVARRRTGDLTGAIEAYETALDLDAGNGWALTNLAVAYQADGQVDAAETALRAAAADRDSPFAMIALADIERSQGNLTEARTLLNGLKVRFNNLPDVWRAMARLAESTGKITKAERFRCRAARLETARMQAESETVAEP